MNDPTVTVGERVMMAETWLRSWWVWLGIGLVLFLWAGLAMGRALAAQQAEQQRRDAHWQQVNAAAARANPRVLPGEEKPAPAPLPGRGLIALLAISATAAVGRAGWLWLDRLRTLWSPGGAAVADPDPDRAVHGSAPGRPGYGPPVSLSRPTEPLDRPGTPLPPPLVQRPPHRPGPTGTLPGESPQGRR